MDPDAHLLYSHPPVPGETFPIHGDDFSGLTYPSSSDPDPVIVRVEPTGLSESGAEFYQTNIKFASSNRLDKLIIHLRNELGATVPSIGDIVSSSHKYKAYSCNVKFYASSAVLGHENLHTG